MLIWQQKYWGGFNSTGGVLILLQGGFHVLDTFWKIFFQKSDFWGTTRSYDAIKQSTDSLEISWQDINIFWIFDTICDFYSPWF